MPPTVRPRPARSPRPIGTSPTGLVLGALWVAGLVTLVLFPKADWSLGPSISGQIHRAASLVAFLALPVAVTLLLRRGTGRSAPGREAARWGIGLAVASLAWFVPIIVAIVSTGRGGAWWLRVPLGLVERGMAVTEVVALVVLASWAIVRARARLALAAGPPTARAPVTSMPAARAPVTSMPATSMPTASPPVARAPAAGAPVTGVPATSMPAAGPPAAEPGASRATVGATVPPARPGVPATAAAAAPPVPVTDPAVP